MFLRFKGKKFIYSSVVLFSQTVMVLCIFQETDFQNQPGRRGSGGQAAAPPPAVGGRRRRGRGGLHPRRRQAQEKQQVQSQRTQRQEHGEN